jgi:hypothetical protein
MWRRLTVLLLASLAFALVLTPSSALAAGGSIKFSTKRIVFPTNDESVVVFNNSNSNITMGDAVFLSGDTDAFRWLADLDRLECSNVDFPTLFPGSFCTYDFRFNPPSAGKFKATVLLPVGDRDVKITLVGTSP